MFRKTNKTTITKLLIKYHLKIPITRQTHVGGMQDGGRGGGRKGRRRMRMRSKGPTRADISQLVVAHAHTKGNPPSGDLWSLQVTFHIVTSSQNAPLGLILGTFRLRMRTSNGTPFGVTWLPVALSVMRNDTCCITTLVKTRETVAHVHAITPAQGRFWARDFRSRDFRWRRFRWRYFR